MMDAIIYAWREEQGDVWTGEWALDRSDKWVPAEANKYILATPEALAASPEVAKLVADAEARGMERAAEICAGLADQVSDAALTGLPEQARLRESMEAAFTKASHNVRALAPADALAEVQRIRAERDAALARVEKLHHLITEASDPDFIWGALDEDARHG